MKNKKIVRIFAFVLVLAMTVISPFMADAARVVGDMNGDGKISVFDAQLLMEAKAGLRNLVNAGGATAESILDFLLYNSAVDAGDTNFDGIIEIYTGEGLQELHNNKDASFIIMKDLDMTGIEWTPVAGFGGILNGNGKTISNLTVNAASADTRDETILNQGFIGDTEPTAQIKDIHFENISVNAAENARSIGLVVGALRGALTNVTLTGTLTDARESHEAANYIGVIAGRVLKGNNAKLTGGTSLAITDGMETYTTTGLCANAKLHLKSKDNVLHSGLVGWAYSSSAVTGRWVDTSYSSSLLSETIQLRQDKVVEYMHAMANVEWMPSETMTFTSRNKALNVTYEAGKVYKGLPYNSQNGSLERMLSVTQSQDPETGVYTIKPLGSGGWTVNGELDYTGDPNGAFNGEGFYMYMGNDCSSAVGWAWLQVSNVSTEDVMAHAIPYKGGVYVSTTPYMIPNDANRDKYGIYPVGDWVAVKENEDGKLVTGFDLADAAYSCTTEAYGSNVFQTNGYTKMLEAYAQTHKADALVNSTEQWYTDGRENAVGGHARLVAADPIVIRESDGTINDTDSYMLISEQGVNFSATSNTRWNVGKKYTFKNLSGMKSNGTFDATSRSYIPVTIRALKTDYERETFVTQTPADSIVSPVTGGVYSYHRIQSVTVIVTSGTKVIYNNEVFTGVSTSGGQTGYRARNQYAYLEELHKDSFYEAAEAAGIQDGATCRFTVWFRLSTGDRFQVSQNKSFKYEAPTAE